MNAVKTRLQGIVSGSGGYSNNLGTHTYLWRTVPLDNSECPAVVIRDMTDVVEENSEGGNEPLTWHNLEVHFDIVAADNTTMTTLRSCLEDIETAIRVDETWSSNAMQTLPIDNSVYMAQEADIVGGILMRVSIKYRTIKFEAN